MHGAAELQPGMPLTVHSLKEVTCGMIAETDTPAHISLKSVNGAMPRDLAQRPESGAALGGRGKKAGAERMPAEGGRIEARPAKVGGLELEIELPPVVG